MMPEIEIVCYKKSCAHVSKAEKLNFILGDGFKVCYNLHDQKVLKTSFLVTKLIIVSSQHRLFHQTINRLEIIYNTQMESIYNFIPD